MSNSSESSVDDLIRQLPTIFTLEETVRAEEGEEVITVSETVSKAAVFYETLRNTLEYDEDHLVRRNAIRRVLKRRLGVDRQAEMLSRELLIELIWARYLPNREVPARMIGTVAEILTAYEPLFAAVSRTRQPGRTFEWVLDLLANDIESVLVPPNREDAFAGFAFRVFGKQVEWRPGSVTEDERELQLYLAVHRTLLKADTARLRSRVFNLYHPAWRPVPPPEVVTEVADRLEEEIEQIETQVRHPAAETISRELRRYGVLFHVILDVCQKDPDNFLDKAADSTAFNQAVAKATEARVKRFRSRLARSAIRAIVFLFLTKMLLALALEFPYDLFISHETSLLPLVINVAFPPLLLAMLVLTIRVPARQNVKNIQNGAQAIVYGSVEFKPILKIKRSRQTAAGLIFSVLYGLTFLLTYGLIAWGLYALGFNVVSTAIFLVFLSLVTFFGVRIRRSVREVHLETSATTLRGALIDIFTLPIVRVGRWISLRAPRVNFFLFFLDFIIDAPFKMAIALIESWLVFVREKKEELS